MPFLASAPFPDLSVAWLGIPPARDASEGLLSVRPAVVPVVLAGTDDDEDEDLGEEEELPVAEPADDESDFDDFDDEFDDDFEEDEDDPDWDHPDDGDAEPPPAKGSGKKK